MFECSPFSQVKNTYHVKIILTKKSGVTGYNQDASLRNVR